MWLNDAWQEWNAHLSTYALLEALSHALLQLFLHFKKRILTQMTDAWQLLPDVSQYSICWLCNAGNEWNAAMKKVFVLISTAVNVSHFERNSLMSVPYDIDGFHIDGFSSCTLAMWWVLLKT